MTSIVNSDNWSWHFYTLATSRIYDDFNKSKPLNEPTPAPLATSRIYDDFDTVDLVWFDTLYKFILLYLV